MLEDYKKFLKENKEFFYMLFSLGALGIFVIIFLSSFVAVVSTIDRNYSNNKKLSTYRENLATFQKCAEKIEDSSLIRTYCGDAPSEPLLIW